MDEEEIITNGALLDTRSNEEKEKDYQFKEVVASTAPVIWVEKLQKNWRKFPIFDQDGSGSCVAQTMAKLLGIMYWVKNKVYVHFSATHIYQRRTNKPQGGMAGVDAFKISQNGVTLEVLVPSQDMNDSEMDAVLVEKYKDDVGKVFKIANYISDPVKDIETIASIIQETKKGVMVWYYFKHAEWTDTPVVKYPTLDINASTTSRHSVTAVDFTLVDGKKCLIIEDSWGPNYGKGGQRIITEDFHSARNWFCAHPMTFSFEQTPVPEPTEKLTKLLKFGMTDPEVLILQNILKTKGVFPTNISSTGYFGSITKKAVEKFQSNNGLLVDGIVGAITRGLLNI